MAKKKVPEPGGSPAIRGMIEKAGGPIAVGEALSISASMVRKWPSHGVQWWHWHFFIARGYNATFLYKANLAAAAEKYGIPTKAA